MALPMKGMNFIQECCHDGGVAAFAINAPCEAFVGTLRSEDSGVRRAGQSRDQSTVFGGREGGLDFGDVRGRWEYYSLLAF